MRDVTKGSVNQSVVIRIIDSADGTPETSVEYDTAGIDLWCRREGALKISITEAALAALDSAHSDGGIEHIGDGYYRFDLPDAAFAIGADGVMVGGTVTGMIVIGCYVPLVATEAGAGAIEWVYTLTDAGTGDPIADADVWVTTDEAGTNAIASGTTDQYGKVTFYLDSGTVYVWRQKSGWDFTNPDQETVS